MANISTERVASCTACGSDESVFWEYGKDRLHRTTDQVFEYRICSTCRSIFQSLRPIQSEVWQCYPSDYGPHGQRQRSSTWTRLPTLINAGLNRVADVVTRGNYLRARLARVELNLAQAGTMLDFGCGAGKYLDRARDLGCTAIGMDFSPLALTAVRARGHTALAVDEMSWLEIERESIGFVRMNHVIEHLYDPATILRRLHSVMKPDALLHVSTPNPAGISASAYRDAWFGLDCPRHIVLFSPERLTALLKEIGFEEVELVEDFHPKDLVRSWAYRRMDLGYMRDQNVSSLVQDGVLNLIFGFKIRGAVRRGGGVDRYHLFARKAYGRGSSISVHK